MNEFKAIADELRLINLQLKQGSEHADDAVARVATLAQEIKNHGILTSRILLSDSLQASDLRENGDSSSKCVAQAALLIPEGFGVCRWTTIDCATSQNLSAQLELDVVHAFKPLQECRVNERMLVLPFVEEIIEDLLDILQVHGAGLDRTGSIAAHGYFAGRHSAREVRA